ncbi:hypothetical protein [Paraburkholderia tropica]|uniref:hypothetical protein n=1 Tax=Paraburkholderia tropica TaxID=92647 RepID=UPI001CC7B60C|nr:hypothetical protein [Paraburkholderia tropica]
MKESTVSVIVDDGTSQTLRLSGVLSEWLFASGFWSEVNEICGTMFDQYEEDEASPDIVLVIQQEIDKKASGLRMSTEPKFEFVRGWAADWTPLKVSANTEDVLEELKIFRNFLDAGISTTSNAIFSL